MDAPQLVREFPTGHLRYVYRRLMRKPDADAFSVVIADHVEKVLQQQWEIVPQSQDEETRHEWRDVPNAIDAETVEAEPVFVTSPVIKF